VAATLLAGARGWAQEPAPVSVTVGARPEVRLSLSRQAAAQLAEPRVRRLLELQLEGAATLSGQVAGPLGDEVVLVWIDLPTPARALVQARAGERPLSAREIALDGLVPDVAARLVVIATAQLVRAQTRPQRARRPVSPRRPTAEELELAARDDRVVTLGAGLGGVVLPSTERVLLGPSMTLSLRQSRVTERLTGRWLGGDGDGGVMRWGEVGLGADYRVWLGPSWRVALGGGAALGSLFVGGARSVDGDAGARGAWSVRAAGLASIELRVSDPVWLGLALEPGAVVRPVPAVTAAGDELRLAGAWLGLDLTLSIDGLARRK
jgi:hypothetical protein